MKLVNAAGVATYGKSTQVIRDTLPPVFTSFAKTNAGTDGFISDNEKALTSALWTLTATGSASIAFSLPLDDTGGSLVCDAAKTYGSATAPRPIDLTSDKAWAVCAQLEDTAGNIAYGKSQQIIRDIVAPTFSSLALANDATDGFINNSEKALVTTLWTLNASGQIATAYTVASDDVGGNLACNAARTYNQAMIATPSALISDGYYAQCVRLSDEAGNITYGKSASLIRDVIAPTFTSLASANAAVDGFVNNVEKTSGLAMYSLVASGQTTTNFTLALSDAPTAALCNASQTYGNNSIPLISSLSGDGTYAVCVQLIDTAGNLTYGKSSQVVRDTTSPTFISLALANAAADMYINDSEKALGTLLWSLSATGHSSAQYTQPMNDTGGALVCDVSKTYGSSTIPFPSSLTTDGAYSLCVKLGDIAGNFVYGKAAQLVRDIVIPSATSISISGGATSTSSINITLSLAATDDLARQMYVTNVAGCASGGVWENFAATKSWTLGQSTGTATVYVRYRDAALNLSACVNDTILNDGVAPTGTSVAINAGAASVAGEAVT
ncbi:MAG: hypothetical protein EOO38_13925, partial [Cytophagaceae bacterium]